MVELAEWQSTIVPHASLTPADRTLVQRFVSEGEQRLTIDELRDGVRIGARSWVGVVRFESFEVRIAPKLVGGNRCLVELIALTSGLPALRRSEGEHSLKMGSGNLFDLVALLLALEVERLARGGLLTDYVDHEDALPVLRGRLRVDRQVLERFGRVDRLICRFDERQHDIWENQLIAAALIAAARHVGDMEIGGHLRRLRGLFDGVCSLERFDLDAALREPASYDRLNAHYRDAHALAKLVLGGLLVEDLLVGGTQRTFAFLLDMNRLFELFVLALLEHALRGSETTVRYQGVDTSIIRYASTGEPYARVVPDLLVERHASSAEAQRLPVDAKYKLYDERRLDNSDIYQLFLYAQAYGRPSSARPSALVIYPASAGAATTSELEIRTAEHGRTRIIALGIVVEESLREIRAGRLGDNSKRLRELVVMPSRDCAASPNQEPRTARP